MGIFEPGRLHVSDNGGQSYFMPGNRKPRPALPKFVGDNMQPFKKAKLKTDISIGEGYKRKEGDVVQVLWQEGRGIYKVQDGEWACTVTEDEIEFI